MLQFVKEKEGYYAFRFPFHFLISNTDMPNLFTHYLTVKRFYTLENDKNETSLYSFMDKNLPFLLYGTQGPDPLFYVGLLPKNGLHLITALKKYGNRLHQLDGRRFLRALIDESYKIEVDIERFRLQTFIFGQFAHYIMDREAHPYILYMSGFDKNGRITGKYHFQHANFEANIDVCLAMKNKMNYFLEDPSDIIPCDEMFLKLLDRVMNKALQVTFDLKKPLPRNFYSNSIRNFKDTVRFSNHHKKIKKALLPKRLMSQALPDSDKLDYPDCLNEFRKPWKDPITGEIRHDSFNDIQVRVADILGSCYHDILRNGFNYETFSRYLDGNNYYGCKPGAQRRYQKETSPAQGDAH